MTKRRSPDAFGHLKQATATLSAASTGTTVVSSTLTSTSVTDKVRVAALYASADTQMRLNVYSKSSTGTLLWRQFVAANGGASVLAPKNDFLFSCTTGEALILNTTVAGNVFLSVLYEVAMT